MSYVVETPEGSWRVAGSRVSLDSIIHAYWQGRAAEAIAADFPSLSLEQVYGAIAFYLHHRAKIDAYLQSQQERWRQFQQESESRNKTLIERIRSTGPTPAPSGT